LVHGVHTVGLGSTQGRQGRILVVVVVMTTWLRVGVEGQRREQSLWPQATTTTFLIKTIF
jgi:hypothetical protein